MHAPDLEEIGKIGVESDCEVERDALGAMIGQRAAFGEGAVVQIDGAADMHRILEQRDARFGEDVGVREIGPQVEIVVAER